MTIPTHMREAFYQHLDQCEQCREHPFQPCAEGKILLMAAGLEAKEALRKRGGTA